MTDNVGAPAPQTHVAGDTANKAEAILRVVRKMIAAELNHAEKPEGSVDRLELDFLLADLLGFTTTDVDEALRIVRRRGRSTPSPAPRKDAFTELLIAAEKVLEGLHARIDAADKHAVPVFHGIIDLSDAIHAARAAISSEPTSP